MPKVSVILPIYNVEKYLKQALDSVINQTLKDIEIICVNDGSKDGSLDIIKEYAAKDSRIKVINKSNSGYGDSMNKGLEIAAGEYIGILEPDDFLGINMYEILYNKAKENDIDFIKSDFYNYYDENNENVFRPMSIKKENYNKKIDTEKTLAHYDFNGYLAIWSGIYKREFLNKNNIRFNTTPGARYQDQGFWWQVNYFAKSVYCLDIPFYHYRAGIANSTNNPNGFNWIIKEYDFIEEILKKNSAPKDIWNIFYVYKFRCYRFNYDKLNKKEKKEVFNTFYETFHKDKDKIDFTKQYLEGDGLSSLKFLIEYPKKYFMGSVSKSSLLQTIFSIKNAPIRENKKYKIITILGIKIKIRKK